MYQAGWGTNVHRDWSDRDDVTLMSPDILFQVVCFGIMECMTATSQHQGTAAGLAPLDGSPSRDGNNCLKVADRIALHNMLRRTADLDRELQVWRRYINFSLSP